MCISLYVLKRLLNVGHILEKGLSMQHSFEEILEKQRRLDLKSVPKTALVESAITKETSTEMYKPF